MEASFGIEASSDVCGDVERGTDRRVWRACGILDTEDSDVYDGGYVPSHERESLSCVLYCIGRSNSGPSLAEKTMGGCTPDGG